MKTKSYADAKLQMLTDASTVRIYGTILDFDKNSSFEVLKSGKRLDQYLPFIPCFCVQHTPENPCPCMDELIFWISSGDIIAYGKVENEAHKEPVYYVDVKPDTDIVVERTEVMKGSSYANRGNNQSSRILDTEIDELIEKLLDLLRTPPTFPNPEEENPDVVYKSKIKDVINAFKLGWKIGKFIDKVTGASDKLADFLCKIDPNCEN